jgi:hypothetical protein
MASAWGDSWGDAWGDSWGAVSVGIIVFRGVTMAGSVTQHKGLSRPTLRIAGAVVTKIYTVQDFKGDSLSRETYIIGGDLP